MISKLLVLVAATGGLIGAANAQKYRVTYTANAVQPTGIIGGVNPSPVSSFIKAGDLITAEVEFDVAKAQVTSLYDGDPTINIYAIPMTYSYKAGSYYSGVQTTSDGYLQIWDNYAVSSYSPHVDAYSFGNLYRYLDDGASPVNLGNGNIFSGLSLTAFDYSGTKLDNDFITALPNYSGWSLSMELSFLNTVTKDFALIRGTNVQATISEISGTIPEPATWAMMLVGFAMVSATTRYRRRKVAVTFA